MVKLKIVQSTGTPIEKIVSEDTSIIDALNDVDTTGKQIAINGVFLGLADLNSSFAENNCGEEVTISVLTKLNNA